MRERRVMSFQFFASAYTFQFPVHQEVKATHFLLIDSRGIYVALEPVLLYGSNQMFGQGWQCWR